MTITKSSILKLKYLSILPFGGRGGVVRFFLLTHGVKYEEELINPQENWADEKKRLIESGDNPAGTLPVIVVNGKYYSQHIALCRYLAKVHDLTSGDDYKDYVQDLVADEYHTFRAALIEAAFFASDEVKAVYKKTALVEYLTKFEALYSKYKTEVAYLSVSSKNSLPLWGDAAIFGALYDNIVGKCLTLEELKRYPCLLALYNAYSEIPSVKEWIEKVSA